MESNTNIVPEKRNSLARTAAIVAVIALLVAGTYYFIRQNSFCFDFAHDTQFGDKANLENPSNEAFVGPRGVSYYVPETTALQTALAKEGFYVDEFELTGGGVYLTSFFGPSTKSAVIEFQKRYSIEPTGEVDNDTIDALRDIYGCTAPITDDADRVDTATSTQE